MADFRKQVEEVRCAGQRLVRAIAAMDTHCRAELPESVLGVAVRPCHLEQGHRGEHEGVYQHRDGDQRITWRDDTAVWPEAAR